MLNKVHDLRDHLCFKNNLPKSGFTMHLCLRDHLYSEAGFTVPSDLDVETILIKILSVMGRNTTFLEVCSQRRIPLLFSIIIFFNWAGLQTQEEFHSHTSSTREHCGRLLANGLGAKVQGDSHAVQLGRGWRGMEANQAQR